MRICEIAGCGRTHHARGWCIGHYVRWRDTGDVRPTVPLKEQSFGQRGLRRAEPVLPKNFDLEDSEEL